MALFSQRMGITPIKKAIQKDSIDNELRTGLWNVLHYTVFIKYKSQNSQLRQKSEEIYTIIWMHHFKKAIDEKPDLSNDYPSSGYLFIKEYFFSCKWNEVYDFIDFIYSIIPENWEDDYKKLINNILQTENSAYRLVDKQITPITDDIEIKEIESAINTTYKSVKKHLNTALSFLSDKKNPDYRNSIKESISAVEAVCRLITGDDKATLGACLSIIRKKHKLQSSFDKALNQLYGYTCNDTGIRHSLTEESVSPKYSDAKFMLVSCSAFVNYLLLIKSEKE